MSNSSDSKPKANKKPGSRNNSSKDSGNRSYKPKSSDNKGRSSNRSYTPKDSDSRGYTPRDSDNKSKDRNFEQKDYSKRSYKPKSSDTTKSGERDYSRPPRDGEKRSYGPRRDDRGDRGGSFGPRRSSGGSGRGFGGRRSSGRGRKKEVKKFDPTMFIKKVEERTVAPTYIPKNTFSDFAIDNKIKKNIVVKGYTTPTHIQDEAIPVLLEGKDIIATANTGTGKTAAFLIPLVHNVLAGITKNVLIIAPTRELADQIQAELMSFKAHTGVLSALCIGGASMGYQIRQLRKRPQFVIGTPGRLMDLERNEIINFKNYNAIVLDEVDTMLDMGFITDIKEIISKLPAKRQSLFFSATIPPKLKDIMDSFLNDPVTISVKTRQSAENVNQDVIKIGDSNKIDLLHDLLIKPEMKKVIIFSRTKRDTDKLYKILSERGFRVASIHGDKSQAQRKRSLDMLKDGRVQILLATDVVARGIDISDITHVINYDLPQTYEDYIHRIGRTGRANKVGQALTFIE